MSIEHQAFAAMHSKSSLRHNPAMGATEGYRRIVKSYRKRRLIYQMSGPKDSENLLILIPSIYG